MKFLILLLTSLSLIVPQLAFAAALNCNSVEGKTGIVNAVEAGVDDSTAYDISLWFTPDGQSKPMQISVKQTLNDNSGKGMFALLLSAQATGQKIKITRCYGDNLAGATLGNI